MTQLPSVSELMISSGLSNHSPVSTTTTTNTTSTTSTTSPKYSETKSPVSPYYLPKISSQPSLSTYVSSNSRDPTSCTLSSSSSTKSKRSTTHSSPSDYFQTHNHHQQEQQQQQPISGGQQFVPAYTTANHRGSIVTTPGSTVPVIQSFPAPPTAAPQAPLLPQQPNGGPPLRQNQVVNTTYLSPHQQQVTSPYTPNFPQYYYYQSSVTSPQQPMQPGEPSYYHPQPMVAPFCPPPPPPQPPVQQQQQYPISQGYYYMNPQQQGLRVVTANSHLHQHMTPPALQQQTIMYDENNALINKRRIIKRRTRTGCLTCRKRRIKCDERKPTCFNCERSKKLCLGYQDLSSLQPRKRNRDTSLDLPKDQQQVNSIIDSDDTKGERIISHNDEVTVPAGYQGMINDHGSGTYIPSPPHQLDQKLLQSSINHHQQQNFHQHHHHQQQNLNAFCVGTTAPVSRVAVTDLLK